MSVEVDVLPIADSNTAGLVAAGSTEPIRGRDRVSGQLTG